MSGAVQSGNALRNAVRDNEFDAQTLRPEALTRCLEVIVRSIETHLLQRAGLRRASGARTGVVNLIQRHGSAANLNVHLHNGSGMMRSSGKPVD